MRLFVLLFAIFSTAAGAQDLRVVTSIAPVQGIVGNLMQGLEAPVMLVPAGSDPHAFSLRPSQVRALQDAQLVVLVGNGMEPWWSSAQDVIGADTVVLDLGALPEVQALHLPLRDGGGIDPHMWLDGGVVKHWAGAITRTLSNLDPENAPIYTENFLRVTASLDPNEYMLGRDMAALVGVNMIYSHDSLQYFEHVYGLRYGAAVHDGLGGAAGAQHIAALAALPDPVCIVIDVNEPGSQVENLRPDAPVVQLDPLGGAWLESPDFMAALYVDLAAQLAGCVQ